MLRRSFAAAAVVACSSAALTFALGWLLIGSIPGGSLPPIPGLPDTPTGEPRTVLLLGSDRRAGDDRPPRSDTILLVRLDPYADAVRMLSIPRDLAAVPGGESINAAYARDGAAGTVRALDRLLGDGVAIDHVVEVDFRGFREGVDAIGCVYVDIDRHYFNDNTGPGESYATIDIAPGYQRLCGRDALDYARYRHGDNDLVRTARQQDLLGQLRRAPGARRLLSPAGARTVADLVGRNARVDPGLKDRGEVVRMLKLLAGTAGKPVRSIPLGATITPAGDVAVTPQRLAAARTRFLGDGKPGTPGRTPRPRPPSRSTPRPATPSANLVPAAGEAQRQAVAAQVRAKFPVLLPRSLVRGSQYVGDTRVYAIRAPDGRLHRAYRTVAHRGLIGEFYGIQGTTWRDAPILDRPTGRRGRLLLFHDGGRLRLVGLRTGRGAYWVANTLTRSLSNAQMLALARSLAPAGG